MTPTRHPLRRCAECKKVIPPRKITTRIEVATMSRSLRIGRGYWTMAYPLCSIACGAVAAVRLLEGVQA